LINEDDFDVVVNNIFSFNFKVESSNHNSEAVLLTFKLMVPILIGEIPKIA